jgi:hypothetical protein
LDATIKARIRRIATAGALILCAVIYFTVGMNRTVDLTDEGLVLFGAERVLNGDVPHRDFFTLYGPGQFYLLAALFKLFGSSVLVERAWDTVVRCISVVLVFIVVRQAAPPRAALLAATASLVWLASFGYHGYPIFPALAVVLGGVALLAPVLAGAMVTSRLLGAGACAGVVAMFRYDIGLAVFATECVVVALSGWCGGVTIIARLWGAVRGVLRFGAGFVIVVMPIAVAFAISGVLPDLMFDVVTYPVQSYVKMRSLPFPEIRELWWHPREPAVYLQLAVYLPLLVCAAAASNLIGTAWSRRSHASAPESIGPQPAHRVVSPWMLLLLVALTLALFGKGVVRVQDVHMGMALVTSLALMGVLAQPAPGQRLIGRSTVVIALLITALFTGLRLSSGLQFARQNIAWASDPASWTRSATGIPPAAGSCSVPIGLSRLACFRITPEMMQTVLYVEERTAPGDTVFSGLSRHDRIFVNDILLYFATNRRSATKWHELVPGLQTKVPVQEEMVRELQVARPKLIVLTSKWENYQEQNDSVLSSGVTILDDYLRHAYEPVASFGPYTILQPRLSQLS